jgi:hypothetical protein
MGAVSPGGVPQDTLDRKRSEKPGIDVAALDSVLLKPTDVKPGGVEGGQIVSAKLKLKGDRTVVVTVAFAGERHVIRVSVPKN